MTKSEFLSIITQFSTAEPGRPIDDSTTLQDLGIDSLASVALLLQMQSSLGISIPSRILVPEVFSTVGTLWHAIQDALQQR